jgi:hypothetical protein
MGGVLLPPSGFKAHPPLAALRALLPALCAAAVVA